MRTAPVLALFLLAACSGKPEPPTVSVEPKPPTVSVEPELPTFADAYSDRECRCVERDECLIFELAEGESENRGFQCRWVDRDSMLAVCSYESRFRPAEPAGSGWSSWEGTTVKFSLADDKSWCWTERSAISRDP